MRLAFLLALFCLGCAATPHCDEAVRFRLAECDPTLTAAQCGLLWRMRQTALAAEALR